MLILPSDMMVVGETSLEPLFLQQMSCMCWEMRSMATVFSAPLGTITSAYFLVGRQNSSKAGFTRVVYWGHRLALGHRRRITCVSTCSRSLPRSRMSLITLLESRGVQICKNSFFQYLHPISGRSNATDSGTVFGMTLALNIIKEFHVMCHFYVPKIKKMHF